jgi:flagellar biosynthesis protein FlhG
LPLISREKMQLINQSEKILNLNNKSEGPKIIAIGGGKGGIGKTIISVNLGVTMVWQKKKVVLVDADLGGANLHTCFGLPSNALTLSDYISENISDINDAVIKTDIPGLGLISGAQDSLSIANVTNRQKLRFIEGLKNLDADYVILDLGAGTSYSVIDFFLAADSGILVMLPEPTSVENVYRFIKVAFYRKLRAIENSLKIEQLVSSVMKECGDDGIKTPLDLLDAVSRRNSERGKTLCEEMMKFNPSVIVNMVRTSSDIDIGASVSFACKKYFGIKVHYLGHIGYSNHIWQSIRNRRPVIIDFPNSSLVTNFSGIFRKLQRRDDA